MKNRIIVFGGVHLDILADYTKKDKNRIDRVGELYYSIGGTAYNIAFHLSEQKKKVSLFSVLNKNSFSTLWILREIKNTLIKPSFQIDYSTYTENGFIAIRQDGDLERAVTSSSLSRAGLKRDLLEKCCKKKDIAVIDCNFESNQISMIVEICKKHNLFIIIAGTSDSKVKRILPVLQNYEIDIITMNKIEAQNFFDIKDINELTVDMIPKNMLNLVITLGCKGHIVYSNNNISFFKAPHISEVISTSGAGDALSAAIASCVLENNGEIDWNACNNRICEFVGKVITQQGTYLKPTRKRVSYKVILVWGITLFVCIGLITYCFLTDHTKLGLYLTIIGLVIAFGQIIRTEIKE